MKLHEAAREWLGVPWKHLGQSRQGIDCAQLVIASARSAGLVDMKVGAYTRRPQPDILLAYCAEYLHRKSLDQISVDDVVVMRFDDEPQHFAIIGDHRHGLSLIHAYLKDRKVVEHRLDPFFASKIYAAYTVKVA